MNENSRTDGAVSAVSEKPVILEIRDLTKTFGSGAAAVTVLRDVSLTVRRGDFISLMGESGSGKSTLLYQIGCLDRPSSGSILFGGTELTKLGDTAQAILRRRHIGFIFQFYNLIPNLNVEDNILLPVTMDGKKPADYKAQLDELLEIVGLADKRKSLPRELSGGQQQRVAIARAVIMSPELLLADEPTGNLDSASSHEIMKLFARLNREKEITVLQVTHSAEMAAYGSKILHLSDGQLAERTAP